MILQILLMLQRKKYFAQFVENMNLKKESLIYRLLGLKTIAK